MIVFVVLDSLLYKLLVEAHLSFHFGNKLLIHSEFLCVIAEVLIFRLVHLVKGMSPYSINIYALFRIRHKQLRYHIFCIYR